MNSKSAGSSVVVYGIRNCDTVKKARGWLDAQFAQLAELLDQIADCRTRGHRISLRLADGTVTRQGETLQYTPPI